MPSEEFLGDGFGEFMRHAEVPEEGGEAAGDHEDGEVPERSVEHARGAAEKHQ